MDDPEAHENIDFTANKAFKQQSEEPCEQLLEEGEMKKDHDKQPEVQEFIASDDKVLMDEAPIVTNGNPQHKDKESSVDKGDKEKKKRDKIEKEIEKKEKRREEKEKELKKKKEKEQKKKEVEERRKKEEKTKKEEQKLKKMSKRKHNIDGWMISGPTVVVPSQPDSCAEHQPLQPLTEFKTLKEKILEHSTLIESKGPVGIYKLPQKTLSEDQSSSIRVCQIAAPGFPVESVVEERVLLCVGATGVGKTTLINGLANYLFDVQWDDEFRFQIIPHNDDVNAQQASSQTQWVTAYSLYVEKGDALKCIKYTIIDTPGFGDTRGIKKDKELDEKIRNLLDQTTFGLDQLHAVCFTTQSGETKMNAFQTYIYNRVLALFGKDVEQNIFMMVTFADASPPQVIQTLKENAIPFRRFFKFNNSALLINNQAGDAMEILFNKMFWDMGISSFKSFMEFVDEVVPVSLALTKEVMAKRQALQVYITGLQENIKSGLVTLDQLRQERMIISQYQSDIDKNSDFTYTVKEYYAEKVDKMSGTFVTNCLKCNRTCHLSCKYANDEEKKKCIAMDANGDCRVCTPSDGGKCHYTDHFNMAYYFKYKERIVQKQSKDLYEKYILAFDKKVNAENMLKSLEENFRNFQGKVLWQTNEIRKCLASLGEIALKPNPLTTVDYIDQMIIAEQDCCQHGWQERVEQLNVAREQAEYLEKLEKEEGINPWGDDGVDFEAQTTETRRESLANFLNVFKPKLKERMQQIEEEQDEDYETASTTDENNE